MTVIHLKADQDGAMTAEAERILVMGEEFGASDVHIETGRLRFRVDGVFHDYKIEGASARNLRDLIGRLKVLGRLKSWSAGVIQEGRIERPGQDVRISVFPVISGEKVVLRYMRNVPAFDELEGLGLDAAVVGALRVQLMAPMGMILIYGPSNSGKTTTAYCCLREIERTRADRVSIATLEDPVERKLGSIAQTDLGHSSGMTYEAALRALLRQDPEVIFLGEIRDAATAELAFQAALTGHLIISTIHAGSALEAVTRLRAFQVDARRVFLALRVLLGQNLLRRNCPECAEETGEQLNRLFPGLNTADDLYARAGKGCSFCRMTGCSGRLPLGWIHVINDEHRRLVVDRRSDWVGILEQAVVLSKEESACSLLSRGVVASDEWIRVM